MSLPATLLEHRSFETSTVVGYEELHFAAVCAVRYSYDTAPL